MSRIETKTWQNLINSPQKKAVSPDEQKKKVKPQILEKPIKDDSYENHKKDPLSKYPIRGLAYTNEVGVAIMGVLPKLGAALWAPALMYFGADIYNKYAQGRDGDYSQKSKRTGFERATFQALASVILPTFAVLGGQKLASKFVQKMSKEKIGGSSQAEILEAISAEIGKGSFKGATKESACKSVGKPIVKLIDLRREQKKHKAKFSGVRFKETPKMDRENVKTFINNNIEEILDLKKALKGEKVEGRKFAKKYFKHFKKLKTEYANDTVNGTRNAIRETMQKYLEHKASKPKTIKTIGGFVALICLALPIDYLVEEVILKKAVKPSLDYVEKKIEENPGFLGFGNNKA